MLAYFRRVSPMQVLLLLVLTAALYFAVAFAGELLETRRIAQQTAGLNVRISQLKAQNTSLKAQVAFAKTDAFVEQQARERLGMIRTGDNPVVIVNAPKPQAAAQPKLATTPTHWQKWAELFQP